jgi:hypothetical protein
VIARWYEGSQKYRSFDHWAREHGRTRQCVTQWENWLSVMGRRAMSDDLLAINVDRVNAMYDNLVRLPSIPPGTTKAEMVGAYVRALMVVCDLHKDPKGKKAYRGVLRSLLVEDVINGAEYVELTLECGPCVCR